MSNGYHIIVIYEAIVYSYKKEKAGYAYSKIN